MKTTTVNRTTNNEKVRTMVCVGMLAAISAILTMVEFAIPFLAPDFYKLDLSEIPVLIGAFALGPMAGVMTELVKILLKVVLKSTNTVFVGEVANFIMECSLMLPAALIYKRKKSRKNAGIGLAVGTLSMMVMAVIVNAVVLLPAYAVAFNMPVSAFVDMGAAVNPAIDGIWTFAFLAVAPFNLVKGVLISIVTILLYKHVSPILKGSR